MPDNPVPEMPEIPGKEEEKDTDSYGNPNVKVLYRRLVAEGMTPKDAAKKIQQETGFSAVTGRPIRQKKTIFTKKGIRYGDYPTI